MATKLKTSLNKGSNIVNDVSCSICKDDGIHKDGLFHCQSCAKYFCDSCNFTHHKFHKEHSVTAKRGGDNWPVTKTVDDALELCEEHKTEKLTMFCEDDEKLLCHVCHLRNHKQCSRVVLLTDKVKSTTQCLDKAQMKISIESLMERFEDTLKMGEQNIKYLQASYENVLAEIVDTRRRINDDLDQRQQKTERKLRDLHSTLNNSLEFVAKHCAEYISKIKGYNIKDIHNKSPGRSFIMYRKCLDQTAWADFYLRKATTNEAIEFRLNTDLNNFLDSCTEFGSIECHETVSHYRVDPNKVVSIMDKSQYNVITSTDKYICHITGICKSSNGEFLIADIANKCVKLLNRAYTLIEQIQLPYLPKFICNVSTDEMAVALSNESSVNEIHFLRVKKGRIVKFKTLRLNHLCYGIYGISKHKDVLFVASGTALFQYTMDGRQVKTLYVDKSKSRYGVVGLGVSPDGERVYLTDSTFGKLLTLTRDGAVTTTLQDPEFITSCFDCNIHVTTSGQVFVLGRQSVSQVDKDGTKVL